MSSPPPTPLDAALEYRRRGWQPIPLPPGAKKALANGWNRQPLNDDEFAIQFAGRCNVGLLLGEPSGWLVDVDLDCPEARALAPDVLPPTPAVTGREGCVGTHWWYVADGARTKKWSDPQTGDMIVELRSTGAQTVVGPSVHPLGGRYDRLTAEPARVDAAELTEAVKTLFERIAVLRHGALPVREPTRTGGVVSRSLAPHEIERRALAYLDAMPPAISGQGGHRATYAAATVLVHGFGLAPERALDLLREQFNPRCEPPWSERELRHKVDDAANKPHDRPRGWLLSDAERTVVEDADLSVLVHQARETVRAASPADAVPGPPVVDDPGPVPVELLRIPGFVSELMDHCLETAPYPNPALAFCGALSALAFLAGRTVRDQADNRTNLYLLSLAHSSSGEDWPRKINARLLHALGLSHCLGDRFASGEGLQDALCASPSMLFQTDEIDGLLQSINKANDARHEGILGTLLTMYSAANSVFPMRRKAGKEPAAAIDQPCLVVFGTAIPNHYYEALSERMLTNGFFARMIIVESGPRGVGQEPRIVDLPGRVLDTARWWAEFHPGQGNLENWHPRPVIVETTDAARTALIESRRECEAEYVQCESRSDPVGTTVWGRTNEHVRKLALLYAISGNPRDPRIDADAVGWATTFAMRQTRRMLFMAASHVAANPFQAECLKLLKKLREAPDHTLAHQVLLKRMKMDAQSFLKLVDTLRQREEIDVVPIRTATRSGTAYRLVAPG